MSVNEIITNTEQKNNVIDNKIINEQNVAINIPLVSIIVPVYKVEKYLNCCLDSIINQTYKHLEIILINDGSPDNSLQICKSYAEKDSRIKVINQENKGLASARNSGLREMSGDFFYFVDSDDYIHPNLIETTVKLAEKEKANIVQINIKEVPADFKGLTIDELEKETQRLKNESIIQDEKSFLVNTDIIQKFDLIQALYNLDLDNKNFANDIRLTTTVVWTKLYRTSAMKDFLFPEGMRMHEDQMVAHRIIQKGNGMIFVDIPYYYYRQSEASLIRVGWTKKRLAILDCYEDRLKCCEEVGFQKLVDFIYLRYLVCMFRNYNMIDEKLSDEECKIEKKILLGRMKKLLEEKRGNLTRTKKIFYWSFLVCPSFFIFVFRIRNRIKSK